MVRLSNARLVDRVLSRVLQQRVGTNRNVSVLLLGDNMLTDACLPVLGTYLSVNKVKVGFLDLSNNRLGPIEFFEQWKRCLDKFVEFVVIHGNATAHVDGQTGILSLLKEDRIEHVVWVPAPFLVGRNWSRVLGKEPTDPIVETVFDMHLRAYYLLWGGGPVCDAVFHVGDEDWEMEVRTVRLKAALAKVVPPSNAATIFGRVVNSLLEQLELQGLMGRRVNKEFAVIPSPFALELAYRFTTGKSTKIDKAEAFDWAHSAAVAGNLVAARLENLLKSHANDSDEELESISALLPRMSLLSSSSDSRDIYFRRNAHNQEKSHEEEDWQEELTDWVLENAGALALTDDDIETVLGSASKSPATKKPRFLIAKSLLEQGNPRAAKLAILR